MIAGGGLASPIGRWPDTCSSPGVASPRPEHWMVRWADAHPDYQWAPRPPGPPFVLEDRVAALRQAITADDEPAVLIAHSAGCIGGLGGRAGRCR
ncbi:alpha/beta hydrolase [Actinoplanes auranticolor]|uniref:Alpha/beta hydrolase family protein n=1 Tax=Actinoplanes auranticolor TaxID=47988 RepID=A0A919SKX1_9ACTN|nr:alpha/beta hydrolase [Actinoplanes auranticolor]GIM73910.1 hypothetical protein Aau02nite_58230 [Actinoplanes auranticolor]